MTIAEQLAAFAAGVTYDDLSDNVLKQVKLLVLDTIGCAIGSLGAEPVRYLRQQADDFGGEGRCTLIGGGMTAPARATFYNTSLVRYLDFNDGYMGPMGTSHPSDNMAPVLAAAEYADASSLLAARAHSSAFGPTIPFGCESSFRSCNGPRRRSQV